MDEHYRSVAKKSTKTSASRTAGDDECESGLGSSEADTCVIPMTVDLEESTDNRDAEQTGVGQMIYQTIRGFLSQLGSQIAGR